MHQLKYMQYRVTSHPVSTALLDFSFEKKIHIDASQEDMGDKEVGHPEDEQKLTASIHQHPVPSPELPHSFAESVDIPTASATTAEEELLLPPDSLPSKVCKCQLLYVSIIDSIGV